MKHHLLDWFSVSLSTHTQYHYMKLIWVVSSVKTKFKTKHQGYRFGVEAVNRKAMKQRNSAVCKIGKKNNFLNKNKPC